MPQSLSALHVHIVFSTKARAPVLGEDVRPRIHAYMAEILRGLHCEDPCVGGIEDHVHAVCALPRTSAPADILMTLKKDSSKFIKTLDKSLAGFHWQSGYGLFSLSRDHLRNARLYVEQQAAHHRKESFQDEYRRLLVDAGIEFDERYMWD